MDEYHHLLSELGTNVLDPRSYGQKRSEGPADDGFAKYY